MKLLRFISYALAWSAAALCATWAFGALYFDFPKAGAFAAIFFVLALLTILVFARGNLLTLGLVFGRCVIVVAWGLTMIVFALGNLLKLVIRRATSVTVFA